MAGGEPREGKGGAPGEGGLGYASGSKVGVERELAAATLLAAAHDARLLVLADAPLEEVCLALHRDEVHPVERVGRAEQRLAA